MKYHCSACTFLDKRRKDLHDCERALNCLMCTDMHILFITFFSLFFYHIPNVTREDKSNSFTRHSESLALNRTLWSIKSCLEQMMLFSSKFKACICGIRSPRALSLAQLRWLQPPDPLKIISFKEYSTSDFQIGHELEKKK